MVYLKIALGIVFLLLGWVYLYRPKLVSRINSFACEKLFNDRVILLYRKKVSIVFFCLALVTLFMGISSMGGWAENAGTAFLMNKESYKLYKATQDYHAGRYTEAITACNELLMGDPKNNLAIHQRAVAYKALKNESTLHKKQGKK
jgi:hypothetical protein